MHWLFVKLKYSVSLLCFVNSAAFFYLKKIFITQIFLFLQCPSLWGVTHGSPPLWNSAQEGCCFSGASLTQMLQPTRGFHRLSCYLCSLWPGTFPQELISYLTRTFHNIKSKKQSKLKSCFLTFVHFSQLLCKVVKYKME